MRSCNCRQGQYSDIGRFEPTDHVTGVEATVAAIQPIFTYVTSDEKLDPTPNTPSALIQRNHRQRSPYYVCKRSVDRYGRI